MRCAHISGTKGCLLRVCGVRAYTTTECGYLLTWNAKDTFEFSLLFKLLTFELNSNFRLDQISRIYLVFLHLLGVRAIRLRIFIFWRFAWWIFDAKIVRNKVVEIRISHWRKEICCACELCGIRDFWLRRRHCRFLWFVWLNPFGICCEKWIEWTKDMASDAIVGSERSWSDFRVCFHRNIFGDFVQ